MKSATLWDPGREPNNTASNFWMRSASEASSRPLVGNHCVIGIQQSGGDALRFARIVLDKKNSQSIH